jgi:HD-GYP domain-containing protein (c-di-GMP phosphodiesterase class II)
MSVMTANAGLDERFRSGDSIRVQDIKSVLCVPVESREEVLGAIYIDTVLSVRAYNRDDLELLTAVGKQVGMAVKRELMKEEKELLFLDTIRAMVAAVEANDLYTAGHSVRVASYAGTLGEALGFNRAFIRRLKYAANLHDVGKVGIPSDILNKPGRLTEEEFKLIQAHPEIGVRIIENIRNIDDITEAVLYHHERIDGKGYPEGIPSGDIPVMSKLIAVADSFDAMTSTRAYRDSMTAEEAATEFERCAGTQFEAEFALKMVELIQDGTIVPIEGDCDPFA